MRRTFLTCLVPGFLFLTLQGFAFSQFSPPADPRLLLKMVEGYQMGQAETHTYLFSEKCTTETAAVHVSEGIRRVTFDRTSGCYYMEQLSRNPADKEPALYTMESWDGKRTTTGVCGVNRGGFDSLVKSGLPGPPAPVMTTIVATKFHGTMDMIERDFGYDLVGRPALKTVTDLAALGSVQCRAGMRNGVQHTLRLESGANYVEVDAATGMLLDVELGGCTRKVSGMFGSPRSFPTDISISAQSNEGRKYENDYRLLQQHSRELTPEQFEKILHRPLPPSSMVSDKVSGKDYTVPVPAEAAKP